MHALMRDAHRSSPDQHVPPGKIGPYSGAERHVRVSARSAMSLSFLGEIMPRVIITHAVQDVDRWLAGKAERHAVLPGVKNATDLVAMDGSNHTAWVFDFDDMDALKAVVSSMPPEVDAKAESHGVIMPMTVYVEP